MRADCPAGSPVRIHPDGAGHGFGAEVQKPLSAVVIGGLLVSTPFTFYVLPLIYKWRASDDLSDTADLTLREPFF
jgi:Cu/Ag efflux pump CusA